MQTNYQNIVQTALSAAGLAWQPFQSTLPTPFPLLQLTDTPVVLHSIDLTTYAQFRQTTDPRLFFQHLSDQFSANGRLLIHLWEDVWQQKTAVVLSRLRALAGISERIPARLTKVQRIDRPATEQFLAVHHLQVVTNTKYKYGLFLPPSYFRILSPVTRQALEPTQAPLLVAVATFSHPRQVTRNGRVYRSVELVRFASKQGHTVVGGLDKLLKAFVTEHQPDDIMTYADRDWSDGRSYERLGFNRLEISEPQAFWVRPGEWVRYYPHRLPSGLTENELLPSGYLPVYNSGSIKFVQLLK